MSAKITTKPRRETNFSSHTKHSAAQQFLFHSGIASGEGFSHFIFFWSNQHRAANIPQLARHEILFSVRNTTTSQNNSVSLWTSQEAHFPKSASSLRPDFVSDILVQHHRHNRKAARYRSPLASPVRRSHRLSPSSSLASPLSLSSASKRETQGGGIMQNVFCHN
jgi:hypothetical protein